MNLNMNRLKRAVLTSMAIAVLGAGAAGACKRDYDTTPAEPTHITSPTQTPANTPMPTLEVIVTPTALATATLSPTSTASPTATQVYPIPTRQPYDTPTPTQKPAAPTSTSTPVPKLKETATATPIPIKYLTDAEKGQLTGYFEKISRGWDQPSVDAANNILSNETLGPGAWKPFFQEYFAAHAFTNNLREYLGYPVYWWFSDTVHANLQQSLYPTLTDIINAQTAAYLKNNRSSLTLDSPIMQSLMNSHRLLNDMVRLQ